jgi:uncharacterized protein (DUF58 family)
MKNWLRKWFAGEQQQPPPAAVDADERADAQTVLQRLEWTVLRRLDGLLQGHHRSLMRGQGLDLADLREYQAQDDVRHIDWNLTARLDQPHVRIYTEDREMTAWFLLDLSGSVDFGSGARRKNHLSRDFVASVARLLTREGNRVGALLYGSAVEAVLPPRGGRLQVLQLLHRLQNRPAPAPAVQPTQLQHLLQAAAHHIKRRSTVFVVSDFISEPGWEASLGLLARRHDVVAVRLFDPLEMELPDLGMVPMRDAETGEVLMVDTHDRRFRQRFAQLAGQREQALRQALSASAVDALELRTDDDLLDALVRFCQMRQMRQRRVRTALPAAA